jgi:hypothetical protein
MKIVASLIFGIFLAATHSASGQNWRDIKPIESSCKDVERTLGGEACGRLRYEYRLPSAGLLNIDFERGVCHYKSRPASYNVPFETVIHMRASVYGSKLFISDLGIDESKLKSGDAGDMLDVEVYESEELGIKMEVTKEKEIITLTYYPPARHDHLRCSRITKKRPTRSAKHR